MWRPVALPQGPSLVNESIENVDRRRTIRRVMNVQLTYNMTRDLLGADEWVADEDVSDTGVREYVCLAELRDLDADRSGTDL